MIDFLSKRLEQVRQRRAALEQQEQARAQRLEHLKTYVGLMKELLHDSRYAPYVELLRETKKSLEVEREVVLQTEDDLESRDHQVLILTGRIQQLDYILNTPDEFLALAEQGETNGKSSPIPAQSAARSPAR